MNYYPVQLLRIWSERQGEGKQILSLFIDISGISHKEERCPQFLQLHRANSHTDDAGGWVCLALRER